MIIEKHLNCVCWRVRGVAGHINTLVWVCVRQGGSGAQPDPCISMKREVIGPRSAVSLPLCRSASQTDIDLWARQGDPQRCWALPKSSFHLHLGKALTPHCCHGAATACGPHVPGLQPLSVPVRVCQSKHVCVIRGGWFYPSTHNGAGEHCSVTEPVYGSRSGSVWPQCESDYCSVNVLLLLEHGWRPLICFFTSSPDFSCKVFRKIQR